MSTRGAGFRRPVRFESLERRTLMAASAAAPIDVDGAVRIDVGSTSAYTDGAGHHWSADVYASGGTMSGAAYTVAGTNDGRLFYTRRWGNLSYNIPMAAGGYTLNLY